VTKIALIHDLIGGKAGGGGAVRQILELGASLRERGHEVVLVCHDYQGSAEFEQLSATGLEIRCVRRGTATPASGRRARAERYWRGMQRVAELVPDDVDVINAYDYPAVRAGQLAARRTGAALLWTRNDEIGWERAVVPWMTSAGAGRRSRWPLHVAAGLLDVRDVWHTDRIVVLSEHDSLMVKRAYGRKARIIRSGPAAGFFDNNGDRDAIRAQLGIRDHEFLVLAFALLMPYRRFEDLIAAMTRLEDLGEVRLLIVGSDHLNQAYGEQLVEAARATGLNGRIRIDRRAVSDAELRDLYRAADLYAFTSSRQSYGLAPLEALASGTPVLVSSGAGVHEVLQGRQGVSVVPPGDPDAIAAAIRTAHRDRGDVELEPTRAWLAENLSNRRYAEAIEALGSEVLRARPALRSV
jgi:glycosyltransferase involved in cell wall biosynthesis